MSSLRTIVTWAKDEPPTPDSSSDHADSPSYDRRNADSASFNTDTGPPSRWWTFAPPRANSGTDDAGTSQSQAHPGSVRHRSMTWLTSAPVLKDAAAFARKDRQRLDDEKDGLNLRVATQSPDTFTLEQHTTLGPQRSRSEIPPRESLHALQDSADESEVRNLDDDLNEWPIRRKRFRNFILVNPYAPLLFRFVNITSTSVALGIATHIRDTEIRNQVLGAIGSSPIVVIIFAPLTLVHVLVAIYLEYFGRPVGLWRTSAKLAHTLSETLFICAWSAALSLCFDNFFTSPIPCASPSSISWYSQLPRPPSPVLETSVGHEICGDQVALICLVAFGLLTYCFNLIISLFRIMEKVKIRSDVLRAS
ncbi:hypothetical protein F5887DRAFT_943129 [Amanita rubescens]|nr:hypothetical protein F5887DRAFT_943129 [Amanita rubescens]